MARASRDELVMGMWSAWERVYALASRLDVSPLLRIELHRIASTMLRLLMRADGFHGERG